jgi:hypothetical protein
MPRDVPLAVVSATRRAGASPDHCRHMPPKLEPSPVLGTVLYSVKAVLAGRAGDVIDLARGAITP